MASESPTRWVLHDGSCGFCSRWIPLWGPALKKIGLEFAPRFGCVLLVLLVACSARPNPKDITPGDSRDAILQVYGEPTGQRLMTKKDDAVWGPIEDFWYGVPMGSRVEIWTYRVDDGDVELYFVDDSPTVGGIGFAPEGVVYEAAQD